MVSRRRAGLAHIRLAIALSWLVLLLAACGTATPEAGSFRSDRFNLEVTLPLSWAGVEGPEYLARPFLGLVAFNSWGQPGFWAAEVKTEQGASYSPEDILGQVPAGEAYVVLNHFASGPPVGPEGYGPEYEPPDLGGLWPPRDCRDAGGATWIDFCKWGRRLRLEVYCQAEAPDATAAAVEGLLASWRFDSVAAGDAGWASLKARGLLPAAVVPASFPVLAGKPADEGPLASTSWDESVVRITQAEAREETVVVSFSYRWNEPAAGPSGEECPPERCHWWRFVARPNGEVALAAEGGAALSLLPVQGAWLPYRDPAMGFAVDYPGDWQVSEPEQSVDVLGRPGLWVEFTAPAQPSAPPGLSQGFRVTVVEGVGQTLTETVEAILSPLAPGFRRQVEIRRCRAVGGEQAMELLHYPPSRWGNRQIIILHEGLEYRLDLYPLVQAASPSAAEVEAQTTSDTLLGTFSFIPRSATPSLPGPTVTPVPTPSPPGPT